MCALTLEVDGKLSNERLRLAGAVRPDTLGSGRAGHEWVPDRSDQQTNMRGILVDNR